MLDARKTVSGYQIIRKSGWRLSGEQGIRQTTEDRWRTRDEVRVPKIEYRLSADLSVVAGFYVASGEVE